MKAKPIVRRIVVDGCSDIMNPMKEGFSPTELKNRLARTAAQQCIPQENGDVHLRSSNDASVSLSLHFDPKELLGLLFEDDNNLYAPVLLSGGSDAEDFDKAFADAERAILDFVRDRLRAYIDQEVTA